MSQIPSGVRFPAIPSTPEVPPKDGFLGRSQKVVKWVCAASPRSQIVAATCACGAGSLFLATFNPSQYGFYPQCFLYQATGIYCPGCGATRALFALLHGRILDALHDNVVVVCALPLIAWASLKILWPAWMNNRWPEPHMPKKPGYGAVMILVILLTFSLLRNVPWSVLDVIRPNCEATHIHFSVPQRSPLSVFGW